MNEPDRIRFIVHKGKKILLLDFSRLSMADIDEQIVKARKLMTGQESRALLTLTDVSGVTAGADVFNGLASFVRDNAQYVKAGAVVGLDGPRKILLETMNKLTNRNLKPFDDQAPAKEWLIGQ